MRALEKDRRRRYGSPDELAADVVRHLRDEPVLAGPPSTTYRIQKFIKRHRVAVAGAGLVAIATVVAIGGTTVGLLRARSAERVAEAEAAKATAINDSLQEVLGSPDPYQRLGREVTVLEALEEAVGKIEGSFPDQPEIRAAVEDTIGLTYLKLGRYEEAEPLLRQGFELRTDTLSADHQDTGASLSHLGRLLRLTNDLDEAEELDRNALRMQRELAGAEHPKVADILYELAWVHTDRGEFDIAESLFREALEMRRKLLGNEHLDVAEAIAGLATAASNKGDNETAEGLYPEVLRMRLDLLGADNLLVEAYPKIKEERGASSAAARDSLARIIALYRAWDKESKAKEYEALAELQPAR